MSKKLYNLYKTLKKCNIDNHFYDEQSNTLNVQFLNCNTLDEDDLNNLNCIENITGDLIISNTKISSLNSFNFLKHVKNLSIYNLTQLKSITGFNALTSIESLLIDTNESLEEIYGFKQLFLENSKIIGFIKIINNTLLESISFLSGLKRVNSSFYLHYNNLTSLNGLDALEYIDASFSLSSNSLSSLKPLKNLKFINGMLGVVNNNLETLEGLENLQYLKSVKWSGHLKTIALNKNKNLKDISALQNIKFENNEAILIVDSQQNFTNKPDSNSVFTQNNISVFSYDKKEPLYKNSVCFLSNSEKENKITPIINNQSKDITEKKDLINFFDQRFTKDAYNLDSISMEESSAILHLIPKIIKAKESKNKGVNIIDYGCGDGRLHKLYEILANSFLDYTFNIIAIDFSQGALNVYHKRCLNLSYNILKDNSQLEKYTDNKINIPLQKNNLNLFCKTSDIKELKKFDTDDISIDIIIAAGVLCRVLGPQNRLEMLSTFYSISNSLFISQPSRIDFASIHKNFNRLRKEKSNTEEELKKLTSNDKKYSLLQQDLYNLKLKLKDALFDGEIYYKAGIVRGLDKKLPDFKDHNIPFFATDLTYAKELLSITGYKHHFTFKGANGDSPEKKWFISIASNLFNLDYYV